MRKSRQERESEILAAALLEFAEQGYSATRIQDVAARIGVTRTDVYRYSETKEALFGAVLRHWTDTHMMVFEKLAAADSPSYLALLKRLINEIHIRLAWKESRLLLTIVLGEGTRFPGAAHIYYRAVIARSLTAIRQVVARGVAAGEFRRDAAAIPMPLLFAPSFLSAIWLTTFNHIVPVYPNRLRLAHLKQIERWLKTDQQPFGSVSGQR